MKRQNIAKKPVDSAKGQKTKAKEPAKPAKQAKRPKKKTNANKSSSAGQSVKFDLL